MKTHITFNNIFFWKYFLSWDYMDKFCTARQATNDSVGYLSLKDTQNI